MTQSAQWWGETPAIPWVGCIAATTAPGHATGAPTAPGLTYVDQCPCGWRRQPTDAPEDA